MKKLMIVISFTLALSTQAQMIGRVQISSPQEIERFVEMGFAVFNDEIPGVVDLIFDAKGLEQLQRLEYQPQQIVPYPPGGQQDIDPEYHTYEELTAQLQNWAAQYPNLCRLDSIGRATQFPRTLWAVKLSDNVYMEEDELAVAYFGAHHACEVLGCETLLYMIGHFLQNYGTDPQITQWMNDYEIFFVPLVNPDGHYAVTADINLFWRKNARDLDGDGVYYEFIGGTWWTDVTEGIDLNRNYNWYWEQGGSGDPRSYYYRGASPFSESEIAAIRNLGIQQRFVCGISFHSYGEVIIYPWNFSGQPAPDQDVLSSVAQGLSQRFLTDAGAPYSYYTDAAQSGQCRNWFYGFLGGLFYCVELNPYPIFIPPGSQLAERTQRYANGATYLLERLSGPGITGHVRDAITGAPLPARVEIQGRISPQVKPRFAEPQYGRFTRLLNNGTYTVLCAHPGYVLQRISNVVVNNGITVVDIDLQPTQSAVETSSQRAERSALNFTCRSGNGSLALELELMQPRFVQLSVYDLLGRLVVEIPERAYGAGRHTINAPTSPLTAGVYFLRLQAGADVAVQKLTLLK